MTYSVLYIQLHINKMPIQMQYLAYISKDDINFIILRLSVKINLCSISKFLCYDNLEIVIVFTYQQFWRHYNIPCVAEYSLQVDFGK